MLNKSTLIQEKIFIYFLQFVFSLKVRYAVKAFNSIIGQSILPSGGNGRKIWKLYNSLVNIFLNLKYHENYRLLYLTILYTKPAGTDGNADRNHSVLCVCVRAYVHTSVKSVVSPAFLDEIFWRLVRIVRSSWRCPRQIVGHCLCWPHRVIQS